MTATIHQFPTEHALDAAWSRFQAHLSRFADDPSLVTNRQYMEDWARLERDFKNLFWAREGKGA